MFGLGLKVKVLVTRVITVYDQLQTMFVATAKVANTSIKHVLMSAEGLDVTNGPHHKSIPVREIAPERVEELRGEYFVFGVVRNPWDRVVSAWIDKCGAGSDIDLGAFGLGPGTAFETFVQTICAESDATADIHFKSQSSGLCLNGRLLPIFVARFEHLERHWADIRAVIEQRSGRKLGALPKLRTSEHKPYRHYYTPDLEQQVRSRYSEDISRFGYDF